MSAHDGDALVGFVNVAWDGGVHAFLLDTAVAREHRPRGIGVALVEHAVALAAERGCEWLHVDYESEFETFYVDACGMRPAEGAALRRLS